MKLLASEVRVRILDLLNRKGPKNVNQVADELGLPQSTISAQHPSSGECRSDPDQVANGAQRQPKVCYSTFSELVVAFKDRSTLPDLSVIEVAMPLGLYTRCEVSAPCGLCSKDGVIGLLDVPDTFLDPDRMRAGLLWFTRGFVEYQFPNNAKLADAKIGAVELALELSSEVPGTSKRLALATLPISPSTGTRSTPGQRRRTTATSVASLHAGLVEIGRFAIRRRQAMAHHRKVPIATAPRFPNARLPTSSSSGTARSGYASASRRMRAIPAASTSSAAASAITARTSSSPAEGLSMLQLLTSACDSALTNPALRIQTEISRIVSQAGEQA